MGASLQRYPSYDPNKIFFSVVVARGLLYPSMMPTAGSTTYATFAATIPGAFDSVAEFGSFIYCFSRPHSGGMEFFFQPNYTTDAGTAFRTTISWENGVYWPAVFVGMTTPVEQFMAYDANGVEYVANVNWDFNIRAAYQGPTKLTTRVFLSNTNHTIPDLTPMRPKGGVFYYGIGKVEIPICLHPSITLDYTTGTDSSLYPYQTFTRTFDATNYTSWPSTLVIEDGEKYDPEMGLYVRTQVEATRPAIT